MHSWKNNTITVCIVYNSAGYVFPKFNSFYYIFLFPKIRERERERERESRGHYKWESYILRTCLDGYAKVNHKNTKRHFRSAKSRSHFSSKRNTIYRNPSVESFFLTCMVLNDIPCPNWILQWGAPSTGKRCIELFLRYKFIHPRMKERNKKTKIRNMN